MSLFNECFYTDDFDQEMIDYVDTLGNFTARCYIGRHSGWSYLKYGQGNDYFWATNVPPSKEDKYLTKQQFKEKIGMTQKPFTKSDLKNGMVVHNSFSGLQLVVGNHIVYSEGFGLLTHYHQNLRHGEHEELDINEVFEVISASGVRYINEWVLKSIWKRPEPVVTPPVPSAEQIEIEKIQAEMEQLNKRLGELKAKV